MKIVGGTIKVESADNIPGAIPKGIYIKTNDQVEIEMCIRDRLYPDNSISREEAFIVLARAFKLSGGNANILDKFTDKNDISDWAREGISSLVAAGYISGSDGRINPKHNITRAEFAQVMRCV